VLEGHVDLVLANAAHVKNVPGRKTDVNDATWLADLLAHGLVRASCSTRAKRTYLRAQFQRLKARRGPKKAIMAVAASMLTSVYFILRAKVPYRDLGPDHFDRLDGGKLLKRLVRKIGDLGYDVELKRAA
jgi:transposase